MSENTEGLIRRYNRRGLLSRLLVKLYGSGHIQPAEVSERFGIVEAWIRTPLSAPGWVHRRSMRKNIRQHGWSVVAVREVNGWRWVCYAQVVDKAPRRSGVQVAGGGGGGATYAAGAGGIGGARS